MIFDCFTFFNEFEILKARLHELNNVVYRHVLVESAYTFSNRRKPLFFEENKALYAPFLDRIIHVVVEDMPNNGNAWDNEIFQRNAIMRGLDNASENDLIMISDVDEIPDKHLIDFINPLRSSAFRQQFFYYDIYTELDYWWHGTTVTQLRNLKSPQHLRDQRYNLPPQQFPGWQGWHLSYFGGVRGIKTKIESMSDTQLNTPEFTDEGHLLAAIEQSKDLFNRDIKMVRHAVSPIPERILQCL